jgi:hypothetical protein
MSNPGRSIKRSTAAQVAFLNIKARVGHTGLVVEWIIRAFFGNDFTTF